MKLFGCIWFLFFLIQGSNAQTWKVEALGETPLQADRFVGLDELDQVYYIIDNTLYKSKGQRLFAYNNAALGEISEVDIQNPFKILLLYKDFNSVVILDNNLNELTNRIDFTRETQFNNVLHLCNSSQNNIWIYADDNRIHLYNYQNLSAQVRSQALTFYREEVEIKAITGTFKKLWVYAEDEVFAFNEFGNFIERFPAQDLKQLFPFEKTVLLLKNRSLYLREDQAEISLNFELDAKVKDVSLSGDKLTLFDGKTLYRYRLIR